MHSEEPGPKGGQRSPSRQGLGMGLVRSWGQGSIRLGGSARARIASCHNNLLLSSRLIDGAELAPRLMPLEPRASPSLAGPCPLWDPHVSPAPCTQPLCWPRALLVQPTVPSPTSLFLTSSHPLLPILFWSPCLWVLLSQSLQLFTLSQCPI